MVIKWKNRKGLNPDVILKKLEVCKKIEGEKVSFSGFEKLENETAIASMLDFGDDISPYDKSVLVSKALFACAKDGINRDNFKNAINRELKTSRAGKPKEFRLLTTISIKSPFKFPDIEIANCKIRFFHDPFPKKYKARKDLIERDHNANTDDEKQFCKVIVSTQASRPQLAGEKCLDALNLLRSFLCAQCNNSLSISFGSTEHKPINKIVLGKYHTLHTTSGGLATQLYWYVPNYFKTIAYRVKTEHEQTIKKNVSWFCHSLQKLNVSDGRKVKGAMLRFVSAFDQTDYHSTLIMGWGSLESLVSSEKESNNDLISRRCSFMFVERDFHRQIIEHIREYRNQNVHYGESTEDPSIICYQLQRYFNRLIYFYLSFAGEFKNISEANSFLDLPASVQDLNRRVELIQRAIKYIAPPQEKK